MQDLVDGSQRLRMLSDRTLLEIRQPGQSLVDLGQTGRRLLVGCCVLTHSVVAPASCEPTDAEPAGSDSAGSDATV